MILCVGTTPTVQRTLTFQNLRLDAVNRASGTIESSSGKSINVARMLHTLGRDVVATGFLGGNTGQWIRADLDAAGIAHNFVDVKPPTRTCTTVIDEGGRTVTELVEETRPVDETAYVELLDLVERCLPRAASLVLSGSMTPGAPADFYARCTRLARTRGVPVVLDGRGKALELSLAERPTIIKPNRAELAETVGYAIDCDDALRTAVCALRSRGPEWVVITDGPHDAIASDGRRFWRITPPPITAVNPIGSGDSFAAGLALAIVDGNDLPTACRLGAACGAANALNSPPGHGRRDDVERLMSEVRIILED